MRELIALERAADAHRLIESGASTGKLVLAVNAGLPAWASRPVGAPSRR